MKVLVTGGTGFVGSHLVQALVRRGDDVLALARSPQKAAFVEELGAGAISGDLDDTDALRRAVADRDVVYHVAGLVHARDEAEFLRVNRDGTVNLAQAASRAGRPRFVLVSSLAAGGPSETGRPRGTDEPGRPVTAYGRSKLAGEQVVRDCDLPWSIVRPPLVYGPRDTEFLRLFKAVRLGVVPVFGNGTQELTGVYGPDLAGAIIAAGTTASAVSRCYCACHPEMFTSEALVRAVARAMGKSVRLVPIGEGLTRSVLTLTGTAARWLGRSTVLDRDKANEFFERAWTGDPEPLARDTGWRAEHDLAAGLAETASWYRVHGWIRWGAA